MKSTQGNKRPAEEGPAEAVEPTSKRPRLVLPMSPPRSVSPSSDEDSDPEDDGPVVLPMKTMEMPTGETIRALEWFPSWIKKDPYKHWRVETFNLRYRNLYRQYPDELRWTWAYEENPSSPKGFSATCWPDAPEDRIFKQLFAHSKHRKLVWRGPWAKQKLQAEIARYERVKWFWCFNDGPGYLHGYDNKYIYMARRFKDEMESPWIQAWLGELIGKNEVKKILKQMEKIKIMDKKEQEEKEQQEKKKETEGKVKEIKRESD